MNIFKKLFGSEKKQDSKAQSTELSKSSCTTINHDYEGTPGIKKLITKESPRQILSEDFPKHQWPISGGWGYTQEDAVVIEAEHEFDGVRMEYKFLEYRSYEEAIIFRPKDQQLAGFRFERGMQSLIHGDNGRSYDRVMMKVTAFREADFNYLRNDWESHNAYEGDEAGKQKHLELADSKKIQYEACGWFDITKFYGKG